jgi:hypothetical protein
VVKFCLFKKTKEKLQDAIARRRLIAAHVNWLKKLTGRLNGANSKSRPSAEQTNLLEQSEWTKKSIRSVEVTVETDDVVAYQSVQRQSTEPLEKAIQSLRK